MVSIRHWGVGLLDGSAHPEGTRAFFGIEKWPEGIGRIDLGSRVLDVIAIPGHEALSVAFYDRQTGIPLTGDALYPGRLLEFTRGKPVGHVLGTHIEQRTAPFGDYVVGTIYQREEHALALSRGALLELDEALRGMAAQAVRPALRDFTIRPR